MSRNVYVDSGELKFAQNVAVGPHALQVDEAIEYGGNDAGPDPHEVLLAALGACASTTVQMYAERKHWPVEGVQVHLSYAKVPGEDGAGPRRGVRRDASRRMGSRCAPGRPGT